MITCGICGMEIQKGERHHHLPDIYMYVWNCQYSLMRTRDIGDTITSETLPFSIPEHWAEWVLDTCGGGINMSGIYRLPGRIWEWCLAKMRGDESITFLEREIDKYLRNQGYSEQSE